MYCSSFNRSCSEVRKLVIINEHRSNILTLLPDLEETHSTSCKPGFPFSFVFPLTSHLVDCRLCHSEDLQAYKISSFYLVFNSFCQRDIMNLESFCPSNATETWLLEAILNLDVVGMSPSTFYLKISFWFCKAFLWH